MRLSLRKRALVALGLALSMVGMSANPAAASAQSDRNRPFGHQSWVPSRMEGSVKYVGDASGKRVYEINFTIFHFCNGSGGADWDLYGNAYGTGSYRGLEYQADFPPNTIDELVSWNGNSHIKSGFNGSEYFYIDTPFDDNGTKRLGWGVANAENMVRCNGTSSKLYNVTLYGAGPQTTSSAEAIVWRASAMHEDQTVGGCALGIEFCMFGDYQHTYFKSNFRSGGTDHNGVAYSTAGFFATSPWFDRANKLDSFEDSVPWSDWAYHIPSHGMNCRATINKWCYDSGYQTGGDLFYPVAGPPGDATYPESGAWMFGDIEGDQTVTMQYDVLAPAGNWTKSSNKKSTFTAEAAVKCVDAKGTNTSCTFYLGAEGVADTDPTEARMVQYTIPQDGQWYACRVDDEHGAVLSGGNSFVYGHDRYAFTIGTSDRWLAVDMAFLGNKTKTATNGFPSSDMYAVPGCQLIGLSA